MLCISGLVTSILQKTLDGSLQTYMDTGIASPASGDTPYQHRTPYNHRVFSDITNSNTKGNSNRGSNSAERGRRMKNGGPRPRRGSSLSLEQFPRRGSPPTRSLSPVRLSCTPGNGTASAISDRRRVPFLRGSGSQDADADNVTAAPGDLARLLSCPETPEIVFQSSACSTSPLSPSPLRGRGHGLGPRTSANASANASALIRTAAKKKRPQSIGGTPGPSHRQQMQSALDKGFKAAEDHVRVIELEKEIEAMQLLHGQQLQLRDQQQDAAVWEKEEQMQELAAEQVNEAKCAFEAQLACVQEELEEVLIELNDARSTAARLQDTTNVLRAERAQVEAQATEKSLASEWAMALKDEGRRSMIKAVFGDVPSNGRNCTGGTAAAKHLTKICGNSAGNGKAYTHQNVTSWVKGVFKDQDVFDEHFYKEFKVHEEKEKQQ